jgi:hypothetical protein
VVTFALLFKPAGERLFRPEPVQDERLVIANRLRDFFHGFDFRAHDPSTPAIQELLRPSRRGLFPETREVLFEQVGTDRFQMVLKKVFQFGLLLLSEVLPALEQTPSGLL